MSWLTNIALFIIFWWLLLFITLPFGLRSQDESGDEIVLGSEPGAPTKINLPLRLFFNTLFSLILFLLYLFIVNYVGFDIDDMIEWL